MEYCTRFRYKNNANNFRHRPLLIFAGRREVGGWLVVVPASRCFTCGVMQRRLCKYHSPGLFHHSTNSSVFIVPIAVTFLTVNERGDMRCLHFPEGAWHFLAIPGILPTISITGSRAPEQTWIQIVILTVWYELFVIPYYDDHKVRGESGRA